MKKIIRTLFCILAISLSMATITACSKVEVTGFTAPATATAEIGEYYEVPMPNIKANCKYSLAVSATNNGKSVFVVNNKVLITDFSKYTITYTLNYAGKTETKTTIVTPRDTTEPIIKFFDIPTTLYTNTEYDLSGVIVDDNSLENLTPNLTIKHLETGLDVDIVNNKFTTPSQKGATLRITGTATDSNGNVANQYKDFYVVDRDDYGVIDSFDSQEITAYSNSNTRTAPKTTFESVSSVDSGEIQGINGRALKMSFTEFRHSSIDAAFINFDTTKMKNIASFDYITFRVYVDPGTAVQDDKPRVSMKAKDTGSSILSGVNGWAEFVVEKQYYQKSNNVILYISYWNDSPDYKANFTVYIDEITGGYDKHVYVNDEINVVESLGLEDQHVTSIELNTTTNATFEEGIFKAQASGVYSLTVTVDKAPYKVTTFTYEITVAKHPAYEDLLGTEELLTSKYETKNNKGSVLSGVRKEIVNGSEIGVNKNVLKFDISGSIQYGTFFFIMPSVTSEQLSKFDYYVIKGYVDVNRNGFRVSPAIAEVDGEAIYKEVRELSLEDVKGEFEYKISKEYFGDNLMFVLSDWTGTNPDTRAKAVYLTSITGGYEDISEVPSVNLIEKTGFTADELAGTYFENERGTQTEISDLTNFTLTESGKIVLVVNVEGFTSSSIEIKVNFYPAYNVLDKFNTQVENYEVTEASTGNPIPAIVGQYNNDGVFFNLEDASQCSALITFKHIPYSLYKNYDYITVKGNVGVNRNGFRISLYDSVNSTEYIETIMADVKGDFTFVIDKKYFKQDYLQIFVGVWTGLNTDKVSSFTITSIEGGYGETGVGEEINLLAKTGLTASELEESYFENASGTQTPITNFTSFIPTEKGKIVFVISVEGYKLTTMEMSVVNYPAFNVLDNFDKDISNYLVTNRTGSVTTGLEYAYQSSGVRISFVERGHNGNYLLNFNHITSDKYSKFDYVTITGYVKVGRTGFKISLYDGSQIITGTQSSDLKGNFVYVIPAKYFTAKPLQIELDNWTGTGTDKAEYIEIYSITGGYNSVYAEEEINLEEKLGLTASELVGSYFENASGEKTDIQDFNVFMPTEQGKIVLVINAQGYTSSTYEIEVIEKVTYNTLESFNGDMSKYSIYDSNGTNKQGVLTTVNGGETGISALATYGKALKAEFTYKLAWGAHISVVFNEITSEVLAKYDYITITSYIDGTGNVQIVPIISNDNSRGNAILEEQSGLVTYTLKTSEITTDCLRLGYRDYTASGGNPTKLNAVYILGIVGGYDAVKAGTTLNLEEKLGLTASELNGSYFESASGKTTITNFTAFTPSEKGDLVLTINKQGYKATTISIRVVDDAKYNELDNFNGDLANYVVLNRDTLSVNVKALPSYSGGGVKLNLFDVPNANLLYEFRHITADKYSKYDYITITGNVDCPRTGFNIGLRENNANVNELLDVRGNFTFVIPSEYFRSDYLQLQIRNWSGLEDNRAKSLTITSIVGGYNDIAVGESVNLIEKTGLTASELEGSYFENASNESTPITDLTAFIPTEVGSIKLVVNKQGYKANSEIVISVK